MPDVSHSPSMKTGKLHPYQAHVSSFEDLRSRTYLLMESGKVNHLQI